MRLVAAEGTFSARAACGDRPWSGDAPSASAGIIGRIVPGDNGNVGRARGGHRESLTWVRHRPEVDEAGRTPHDEENDVKPVAVRNIERADGATARRRDRGRRPQEGEPRPVSDVGDRMVPAIWRDSPRPVFDGSGFASRLLPMKCPV